MLVSYGQGKDVDWVRWTRSVMNVHRGLSVSPPLSAEPHVRYCLDCHDQLWVHAHL